MNYEMSTGKVSLLISSIGPGDEGEYTCTAVNKFGEAICTVYIQPEGNQQLHIIHLGLTYFKMYYPIPLMTLTINWKYKVKY